MRILKGVSLDESDDCLQVRDSLGSSRGFVADWRGVENEATYSSGSVALRS